MVRPAKDRGQGSSTCLRAGGPTRQAKLKNVRILRPAEGGTINLMQFNLEDFVKRGDPRANPQLLDGDTVVIEERSRFAAALRDNFGLIVGGLTSVLTLILLYDRLQEERNN